MPLEPVENPSAVETAACCANPDAGSKLECGLCNQPTCKNCRSFVNGRRVCRACKRKIQEEVNDERATGVHFIQSLAGGAVAAIVAGAIWAIITIVSNMEIGYVAVGVGYLAGQGVFLASGKKRGTNLQLAAVGSATFGLFLGKYFIIAHAVKTMLPGGADVSYVDPKMLQVFIEIFPSTLSPFDILWLVIALGAAWSVPKPTAVNIRG